MGKQLDLKYLFNIPDQAYYSTYRGFDMCRFNLRLAAAFLTFGIGVLFVSFWLVNNYSFAASVKNSIFQPISEAESQKNTEITLQRSVCFGTCPDYTLTISEDGTVVFEGRMYVKNKGTIKSQISQEKIQQIIKEFEKADYFSLNDKGELLPLSSESVYKKGKHSYVINSNIVLLDEAGHLIENNQLTEKELVKLNKSVV